jgi:carbon storage regulator
MLVLSRRIGEEIVIDNNVVIRVVGIQGGRVRVAVAAPSDVTVDRAEIHQRRRQFGEPDDVARLNSHEFSYE